MKNIKPYKVFLYVGAVLSLLFVIAIFAPEEGYDVFGVNYKFLTYEKMVHPKVQEKKDVKEFIQSVDTIMQEDPMLVHGNNSDGSYGEPVKGDFDVKAKIELQMDEVGVQNLHKFFKKLSTVSSKREKLSILHYGDSQIEGDRMTSFVRQKLQLQFGGTGPGLIPATNVYNTFTFKQTYSENFERFTCFGGASLESKMYGAMGSASRFTPEYIVDSTVVLDTLSEQTGWIEIAPSKSAYSRAKMYNNVRVHYNSCVAETKMNVFQDGVLIHEELLNMDGAQHSILLTFAETPQDLKFEFKGKVSPNICGFSLEGDFGVEMSNIGMRGSSGTTWGRMAASSVKPMYDELNTEMVIMQFGGNSVPYFKDSSAVTNYARYFKGQINRVKRLRPSAMIIVIGPSDMSKFEDDVYETYEFLPFCVEEMTRVTKEAGGAYFSLYDAMGGRNSMHAWVEEGLAGDDHIHFSNAGAKIAAQRFYEALIAEYGKWQNQGEIGKEIN